MVSRTDYSELSKRATEAAILEIHKVLGEYTEHIVIVGGYVPLLLLPNAQETHVGTQDIDLALNHIELQEFGYDTIRDLLLAAGYQEAKAPFRFKKEITINESPIVVFVDLLAGEYGESGKSHKHQKIQDIRALKLRGSDMIFDSYVIVELKGMLPNGSETKTKLRVVNIPWFLTMKGNALAKRQKSKDAYDIVYVIRNYEGGIDAIVKQFESVIENPVIREGLDNIANAFESMSSSGPIMCADFENETAPELRANISRDAFERLSAFLNKIDLLRAQRPNKQALDK